MLCQTTAMLAWQGMAPLARPTSVGSIDSTVRPVRCHWHDAAYADRCTELLQGIEDAWAVQVDEMGFPAPVPDSDGILDVYIDGGASAFGAYAYGPSVDADSSDDRMSSAAYIAIHADYEEDWRWTMLHEFNHVLQYATDFTEPRYVPWEGTATAAEVWTDPTLEVVPQTIADFQLTPWVGLLGDSWQLWDDYEIWSYYEYGSALWLQFLDAQYGDGAGSAGVELWLNSAQAGWMNEPDFLDASGQWTGDWQTPLMDFSLARARLGTDDAPDWGANLDDEQMAIGVDASFSSDELPATLVPAMDPFQTGAVYGEVRGLEPGDELVLRAEGEAGVRWGLLVVDGTDGSWTEADTLTWTVDSAEVVVGVVHLGGMDFDADEVMATSPVSLLIGLNGASPPRSGAGDTGVGAGGGVGAGAKGCTCASGSLRASGLAWWALLALPFSRRRDRATARLDAQTAA
jgi:hypothetical protein